METKQHATKKTNGSMRKSKKKSEFTSREMKLETQHSKIYGYSKSSSKKEIYSDTDLPQETRKISNKQPNLIPRSSRDKKRIRKTRANNSHMLWEKWLRIPS